MALLKKDQILAANDIPTQEVAVPEWGGEVLLRGLSGIERDKYEASCVAMKNGQQVPKVEYATARLVAWCAVDENNSRIFIGEDEVRELAQKSSSAIQRLFNVACQLSGLTERDVEELTAGFDGAPSGSSTSG